MKKLSEITESVWHDIRKKSLGLEERTESSIDLMDINDFIAYLQGRYKCNIPRKKYEVENWFLAGPDKVMQVEVPIEDLSSFSVKMTYAMRLTYDYKTMRCIDIMFSYGTFYDEYPEFKKYVQGSYRLIPKPDDDMRIGHCDLIVAKEGSELMFHDYVELIDKALSCVKKPYLKLSEITESVWRDIRKKSLGKEDRIESGIDFLSCQEFLKYLKNEYICYTAQRGIEICKSIIDTLYVPICHAKKNLETNYTLTLENYDSDKKIYLIKTQNIDENDDLYLILEPNYSLTIINYGYKGFMENDNNCIEIKPKDGVDITNKFFLNLINHILKNLNGLYNRHIAKKIK